MRLCLGEVGGHLSTIMTDMKHTAYMFFIFISHVDTLFPHRTLSIFKHLR